jgi:uncharacterized membrane protein YphA (DoxX/SURF4 family)
MAVIRIGLGIVWALNLVFVLDPANQFFPGFAATAQGFSGTSLGGPALAEFVASNGGVFSVVIAAVTGYLAVALLLGATTRWACAIGFLFNTVLLITQVGSVAVLPGGTDVGPMPLYLVAYLGLLASGGPTIWSVDRWWAGRVTRPGTAGVDLRRPNRSGSLRLHRLGP